MNSIKGAGILLGVASLSPLASGSVAERVIGGENASSSWPFLATILQYDGSEYTARCLGALIADRYVLTSAYCIEVNANFDLDNMIVNLGDNSPMDGEGGHDYRVTSVTPHPQFDFASFSYDFALIELSSAASEEPVSITSLADGVSGTGLGLTDTENESDEQSRQVMQVGLTSMLNTDCESDLESAAADYSGDGEDTVISDSMLCAMGEDYEEDGTSYTHGMSSGDTGAPLVISSGDSYQLAGILSFGNEGREGIPDVFARAESAQEWIDSVASDDESGSSATGTGNSNSSGGGGSASWLLAGLGVLLLRRTHIR